MPLASPKVTVRIDGKLHSAWTEIQVKRCIDQAAGEWELHIPLPASSGKWGLVTMNSKVEIMVDGEVLLTGKVEKLKASKSKPDRKMVWGGRSGGGSMCDCSASHPTKEWPNATPRQILADLGRPFGQDFQIKDIPEADRPLPDTFRLNHGEGAIDAAWRVCSLFGAQIRDRPDGGFMVARGTDKAPRGSALRDAADGLILDWTASWDATQQHSTVEVHGQKPDDTGGAHDLLGVGHDTSVKDFRPLIIDVGAAASKAQVEARAKTEVAAKAAKSWSIELIVQGWRDGAGKIWAPGTQHLVELPDIGVNRTLLVAEVTYDQSLKDGSKAHLRLIPPEAYQPGNQSSASTQHAPGTDGLFPVGNDAQPRPDFPVETNHGPPLPPPTTSDGRAAGPV